MTMGHDRTNDAYLSMRQQLIYTLQNADLPNIFTQMYLFLKVELKTLGGQVLDTRIA